MKMLDQVMNVLATFPFATKDQIKAYMKTCHFTYGDMGEDDTADYLFQKLASLKRIQREEGEVYKVGGSCEKNEEESIACFSLYLALLDKAPLLADRAKAPGSYVFFQEDAVVVVVCGGDVVAKMRYVGASAAVADKVIAIKTPDDPVFTKDKLPPIPFAIYEYKNGELTLLLEGEGRDA